MCVFIDFSDWFFSWYVSIGLIICSCCKLAKVFAAILKTFFFDVWIMVIVSHDHIVAYVQALIFVGGPINSLNDALFYVHPSHISARLQHVKFWAWLFPLKDTDRSNWLGLHRPQSRDWVEIKMKIDEWLPGINKKNHPTGTSFGDRMGVSSDDQQQPVLDRLKIPKPRIFSRYFLLIWVSLWQP